MDYTQQFKYSAFRVLLFYMVNTLGLMLGKGLFWLVATLVPASQQGLKQALVSDTAGSVTAALIMAAVLGAVFRDDAKRHAAYDDMDVVLVLITLILMLGTYFVPVIFYNPFDSTRAVKTMYYLFYFPCRWVTEIFGADTKASAAVGGGAVLAVQLIVYELAYNAYKKKHPVVFRRRTDDEDEDTETYDDNEI